MAPTSKRKSTRAIRTEKAIVPAPDLVQAPEPETLANGGTDHDADHDLLDSGVVLSVADGRTEAPFSKARQSYHLTVTMESHLPFTVVPTILKEGLFKNRQTLLINEGTKSNGPSLLLDLPPELRAKVLYSLLGDFTKPFTMTGTRNHTLKAMVEVEGPRYWTGHYRSRARTDLAIFFTSKQMYEEAAPIFYGNTKFICYGYRVFLNFLKNIGSCIMYLRYVTLGDPPADLGRCTSLLVQAPELKEFRVKAVSWVAYPPEAHYFLSSASSNTIDRPHLYAVHDLLKWQRLKYAFLELFTSMSESGKSVDEILGIIRFDADTRFGGKCTCAHAKNAEKPCVCKEAPGAYERWLDGIKVEFQGWVDEKQEVLRQKKEKADAMAAAEDDYSYLEPASAPERHDTGRPKRRTALEHAISYADM